MNKTDRVLGSISAMMTLIEYFPMGLFDREGKTYTSAFEFLVDILRCCGINDREIITFLIGKIYGFEGKPGFSINGLYDLIINGKLDVDLQNSFMMDLEKSIKLILMSLFTSIYTCSAVPILSDKYFDYDALPDLMKEDVINIVTETQFNDDNYKLKIPVSLIDMIGMLSISPVSQYGKIYYSVNGGDIYYKKANQAYVTLEHVPDKKVIPGQTYTVSVPKYSQQIKLNFNENGIIGTTDGQDNDFNALTYELVLNQSLPIDLEISVSYSINGKNSTTETLSIPKGSTSTTTNIIVNECNGGGGTIIRQGRIFDVTINGYRQGCEVNIGNNLCWLYLSNDPKPSTLNVSESVFGEDKSSETVVEERVATSDTGLQVDADEFVTNYSWSYVKCTKSEAINPVRYSYVPTENITEESPNFIVCYEGQNPNILYRTYDMNAFIWYCINRGNTYNQNERNHLMWDNRVSTLKNDGVSRNDATDWNNWYNSKLNEGDEFTYLISGETMIYPIIQIEPYGISKDTVLIRIPSQTYFAPQKRIDIIDGTYPTEIPYFNSSVYKFDWDYLNNIQLLNPRLLLARFVESLLGFSLDAHSNKKLDILRKEIKLRLSTAVANIITANDMEIEDCWKSFSNDDFNTLINDYIYSKYTATKYNGESKKIRKHNVDSYFDSLNEINTDSKQEGSKTMITKFVTDVMLDPGIEPSTEWNFEEKLDSNLLQKLTISLVMPIVESLFTPQVMLLMLMNFEFLGIVRIDGSLGNDFSAIVNLLINKLMAMVYSLVLYVKEKIVSLLTDLFKKEIKPILNKWLLLLLQEQIDNWLRLLTNALKILQMFYGLSSNRNIGYIEDVSYADIVKEQNIPQNDSSC